jgi:hypothetical protein
VNAAVSNSVSGSRPAVRADVQMSKAATTLDGCGHENLPLGGGGLLTS